jgi:DNA modification methylase
MEIIEKVPKIKRVISVNDVPALLPENVDERICNEIDALTEENNTFWSSPDHDRSEYLHSFFQYPAMMVPIVQKKLIEIILRNQPATLNVLDPYMGSGTSLVACMENGLNCYVP